MAIFVKMSSSLRISIALVAVLGVLLTNGLRGQQMTGKPRATPLTSPTNRTYYIAADELMWNYVPRGNGLTGVPSSEREGPSVPTTFLKAIYREYSDATFATLKPRPPEWEHLGILGPLIRAQVGDTITIIFLNNTKGFYTMHPHGLAYAKSSEGAYYNDGTSGAEKEDDMIPPGKRHTYTWTVPPRAGPAPGDPSSILWMYHSHFVESRDMNSGLIGPIVISRQGSTGPSGRPSDVDREFIAALAIFDETASAYFEPNVVARLPDRAAVNLADPAFRKRYLMYTINGLLDGNLPPLTMKKGERVRWYLLSNSNEEDVHAAHWHGQTVVTNSMRTDTVSLAPMAMTVADMIPDTVGTWLFHCHVNEHFDEGMKALFSVVP
jgi:FtsP/CotA-like multicopper oxidase with cupredoxin domain